MQQPPKKSSRKHHRRHTAQKSLSFFFAGSFIAVQVDRVIISAEKNLDGKLVSGLRKLPGNTQERRRQERTVRRDKSPFIFRIIAGACFT